MFLFNKKTRNVIKYIWIVLTIIIVLSMVLTYSGFTSLARTPATTQEQQIEVPPEIQAQLQAQKEGQPIDINTDNSPEKQQVLKAIEEGRLNIDPGAVPPEGQPAPAVEGEPVPVENTPPAPALKLEI